MKFMYVVLAALILSACASKQTVSAPSGENAKAIEAFEDVCLKTAPSFSDAAQAAIRLGIDDISGDNYGTYGFNKDKSMGVQIKKNEECVITTPAQQDGTLTRQLYQVVGKYAKTPLSTRVPFKVDLNGVNFVFHHDRRGGEAFVMLRAKN
jgi:hypothetical protein